MLTSGFESQREREAAGHVGNSLRALAALAIAVAGVACAPHPKDVSASKATLPPEASSSPVTGPITLGPGSSPAIVEVRTSAPLAARATLTDNPLCYDDGAGNLLIQGRSSSGDTLVMQISHPAAGSFDVPGASGKPQLTKFSVLLSGKTLADPGAGALVLQAADGRRGSLSARQFGNEPKVKADVTWRCT